MISSEKVFGLEKTQAVGWGCFAERELAKTCCDCGLAATRFAAQEQESRFIGWRQPLINFCKNPSSTSERLGLLSYETAKVNPRVVLWVHFRQPFLEEFSNRLCRSTLQSLAEQARGNSISELRGGRLTALLQIGGRLVPLVTKVNVVTDQILTEWRAQNILRTP